jgi:hypothetical protein
MAGAILVVDREKCEMPLVIIDAGFGDLQRFFAINPRFGDTQLFGDHAKKRDQDERNDRDEE